ncbi:hypothetical protein BAUCODRAFT_126577 [Baudoinia panamericana UAMH 10762]|uniref:Uncharacterized protein n=1 Tax=Baudoinia panamericana (strain UAMH 10762) TaxID=717646 RepID=M2M4P3_BAUPA|nr:uncharacterized protein BAUCODRAFT_126577 [Baudoinia panamericana UAMH 10762]EMC91576.1 hypothetical protein BAUCODRAFT_126577 [Baudoinia panamericana UAMH 10762]
MLDLPPNSKLHRTRTSLSTPSLRVLPPLPLTLNLILKILIIQEPQPPLPILKHRPRPPKHDPHIFLPLLQTLQLRVRFPLVHRQMHAVRPTYGCWQ